MHSVPTQHQKCLLESTQTEEIICMFLLALLCVDWQMLCLNYSVMFACQHRKCCIFVVLSNSTQQKHSAFVEVGCYRKCQIPHTAQAAFFPYHTRIKLYEFNIRPRRCRQRGKAILELELFFSSIIWLWSGESFEVKYILSSTLLLYICNLSAVCSLTFV